MTQRTRTLPALIGLLMALSISPPSAEAHHCGSITNGAEPVGWTECRIEDQAPQDPPDTDPQDWIPCLAPEPGWDPLEQPVDHVLCIRDQVEQPCDNGPVSYDYLECVTNLDNLEPEVYAEAWMDGICTGSKMSVAEGEVGGTAGGVFGSVSATARVTALIQYDFACQYSFMGRGSGNGGFAREVYTTAGPVFGTSCSYNGVTQTGCGTQPFAFYGGTFGGSGIAGVVGPREHRIPVEIEVCPDAIREMEATNAGPVGTMTVSAPAYWYCTNLAIAYGSPPGIALVEDLIACLLSPQLAPQLPLYCLP